MDGLAQQAAKKKPVKIKGKWFYEGVVIPETEALNKLGTKPKEKIDKKDDKLKKAMTEQKRMKKVGQNPIGAAMSALLGK